MYLFQVIDIQHTMKLPIYQVDAFADRVFSGNYAAVCPLKHWLDDTVMLNIAKENNLPETAFILKEGNAYHIRWFTPDIEMDLCGHATLASAHVIFEYLGHESDSIVFTSVSGPLKAFKKDGHIFLDFPVRPYQLAALPQAIKEGISPSPNEVYHARDYLLVYDNEETIRSIKTDQKILDQINLDPGGIIISAPGSDVDFVSRFFTPQSTIFEDPVTGSAHCTLIPYWAERLQKDTMTAKQLSEREGSLQCELHDNRVHIGGKCVTYLKGEIYV